MKQNPEKNDPVLAQLDALKQEIKTFDWKGSSLIKQQQEIKKVAEKLMKISKTIPLSDIVELGGDAVSVAICAVNPANPIACFAAIIALVDVVKLAKQKKQ